MLYNGHNNVDVLNVLIHDHHAELLRDAQINRLLREVQANESQTQSKSWLEQFRRSMVRATQWIF